MLHLFFEKYKIPVMKKLLVASLLAAFATTALGQNSKLTVGVESSITRSSIRDNEVSGLFESQTGYGYGLSASYSITPYFSINSGLGFERKGRKVNNIVLMDPLGNIMSNYTLHLNYDYLVLPVKAAFQTKGKVKVYINGGFFVGYMVNYSETSGMSFTASKLTTSDFNRFEGGLTAGAGAYIPLFNKVTLSIGIVDNLGLSNIYKSHLKSNTIGALVGLRYSL